MRAAPLPAGIATLAIVAVGAACGTGTSPDTPSGPPPPGTPPPGPTAPPAIAQGDPCRGAPLPVDQYFSAPGTCARLVGNALGPIRQLSFTPDGVLFAATRSGTILRLADGDGDGFFAPPEVQTYASFDEGSGNNVDIDVAGGWLYAGTATGVRRWSWTPTETTGGPGQILLEDAPTGGHGLHTVRVYDGFLYVGAGSAGNAAQSGTPAVGPGDYDDNRSLVRRFPLASFKAGSPVPWLSGEIVTQGLRNPNGFTRNAQGRIFAVVNGLDDITYGGVNVHWDNPGEQLVEIAPGKSYGYPFCFTAQRVKIAGGGVVPTGTQLVNEQFSGGHDDAWCAAHASPPTTFIQAHSAPLDILFFEGQPTGALPERWRGGAFVALHGSWDRTSGGCPPGEESHCVPTGYKVVWIPFRPDGSAPMPSSTENDTTFPYETVFGGGTSAAPHDGAWSWQSEAYADAPRPAGVAISPIDGALYVSSDIAGTLYRIGLKK
jgi:glucose/arabinose dehydrogenase